MNRNSGLLGLIGLAALGLGVSMSPARRSGPFGEDLDDDFTPTRVMKARSCGKTEIGYLHVEEPMSKRRKRRLRGKGI